MKLFLHINAKKIETVISYFDNYLWNVGIQNIYLFIRKNKDDAASKEFYYLGEVYISKIEETTMANDVPVCEIYYHLDQPVRSDIYDYILS